MEESIRKIVREELGIQMQDLKSVVQQEVVKIANILYKKQDERLNQLEVDLGSEFEKSIEGARDTIINEFGKRARPEEPELINAVRTVVDMLRERKSQIEKNREIYQQVRSSVLNNVAKTIDTTIQNEAKSAKK